MNTTNTTKRTSRFAWANTPKPEISKPIQPAWLKDGIQIITPEIAKEMLSTSIGNRNISMTEVKRMAVLMAAGKWIYNGFPITFDIKGKLTNGHHRLNACVLGNTSFKTLVATGVEEDARNVDDTHRPKSAADLVAFSIPEHVKPYGNRYMAACAAYMMYKNEIAMMPHRTDVARFAQETRYSIVSSALLLEINASILNRYTSLLLAFEGIVSAAIRDHVGKLPEDQLNHNVNLLDEFIQRLIDGENIRAGSAVYALRERLLRNDTVITGPGTRIRFLRACIMAYNNYVMNKPMSKVVINIASDRGADLDFVKPRIVGANS